MSYNLIMSNYQLHFIKTQSSSRCLVILLKKYIAEEEENIGFQVQCFQVYFILFLSFNIDECIYEVTSVFSEDSETPTNIFITFYSFPGNDMAPEKRKTGHNNP